MESLQKQNTTIELDDLQKLTNQPSDEVNKSLDIKHATKLNILLTQEKGMNEEDNLLSNRSSQSPRGEKKSDESKGNTTMSSQMNQFDHSSTVDHNNKAGEDNDIMLNNL